MDIASIAVTRGNEAREREEDGEIGDLAHHKHDATVLSESLGCKNVGRCSAFRVGDGFPLSPDYFCSKFPLGLQRAPNGGHWVGSQHRGLFDAASVYFADIKVAHEFCEAFKCGRVASA